MGRKKNSTSGLEWTLCGALFYLYLSEDAFATCFPPIAFFFFSLTEFSKRNNTRKVQNSSVEFAHLCFFFFFLFFFSFLHNLFTFALFIAVFFFLFLLCFFFFLTRH